jgi:hypothetical protein
LCEASLRNEERHVILLRVGPNARAGDEISSIAKGIDAGQSVLLLMNSRTGADDSRRGAAGPVWVNLVIFDRVPVTSGLPR